MTHDPETVGAFLARYPCLVPLLTEALGPLGEVFGTDTPLVVAVETDHEVAGWYELCLARLQRQRRGGHRTAPAHCAEGRVREETGKGQTR